MFSSKEVGDYINAKSVFIKCVTDKNDPENIKENYKVAGYPTFIYLDSIGEEVNRGVGAQLEIKRYLDVTQRYLNPDNFFKVREQMSLQDSNEALKYMNDLCEDHLSARESDILLKVMNKFDISELLNSGWIEYYTNCVGHVLSPAVTKLLENSKKVKSVIGERKYNELMRNFSFKSLSSSARPMMGNLESTNKYLDFISKYPELKTDFYTYVSENKEHIFNGDIDAIIKWCDKAITKMDRESKYRIIENITNPLFGEKKELYGAKIAATIDVILKNEEDKSTIEKLTSIKNRIIK